MLISRDKAGLHLSVQKSAFQAKVSESPVLTRARARHFKNFLSPLSVFLSLRVSASQEAVCCEPHLLSVQMTSALSHAAKHFGGSGSGHSQIVQGKAHRAGRTMAEVGSAGCQEPTLQHVQEKGGKLKEYMKP